jgi:predicted nucleotidyltransferase
MNLFIDQHQQILSLLLKHQVDFIIIGGYSVIYHGYARTTGDVDIWLKPDNQNRDKLISAFETLKLSDESIEALSNLDFSKHLVFHIWQEPEKVDFLTYISGVHFEEANEHKIIAEVDGLSIPFLHLKHLILSKMASGRLKDKADIEELQKIMRYRNTPK